ncbi:TMEM175 family protein [Nocardioides sp. GXQ0305]|uniref:TMEM175 family protein n=1 Tax=Nocardioides sp. GXQ0305 TaxID=3423912 RepID=UPI003D7E2C72
MVARERERGFERFITFVDAIVAIAITLLVLPLVELTAELDDYGSVSGLLRENQAEIWAFLLSFAVIARLWFVQHDAVEHVVAHDKRVERLLLLWALTIVFLPFPTSLVAEAPEEPATKLLYIGSMVLSTMLLTHIDLLLVRHPELTDGNGDADPVDGAANVAMLVLALLITLLVPATHYFPLLLLLAADPVARAWHRLRGGGSRSAREGD